MKDLPASIDYIQKITRHSKSEMLGEIFLEKLPLSRGVGLRWAQPRGSSGSMVAGGEARIFQRLKARCLSEPIYEHREDRQSENDGQSMGQVVCQFPDLDLAGFRTILCFQRINGHYV